MISVVMSLLLLAVACPYAFLRIRCAGLSLACSGLFFLKKGCTFWSYIYHLSFLFFLPLCGGEQACLALSARMLVSLSAVRQGAMPSMLETRAVNLTAVSSW